MPIVWKTDIVKKLKDAGYTVAVIKDVFGGSTQARIHKGEMVGLNVISSLCTMLNCQPEDIIMHDRTDEEVTELTQKFIQRGREYIPPKPKRTRKKKE